METDNCNLQLICETLLETYNTSILDRSEKFFKKACIEEAKKCVEKEEINSIEKSRFTKSIDNRRILERTVLSQLILNHSNESNPEIPPENKKPIANYIGGPYTLTMHWNKEYKKIIYIFGESHSRKTDCDKFKRKDGFFGKQNTMLIEDYLEQLIRNTDVFIDFYLEIGREQNLSGNDRISKITQRLKHCFYNFRSPNHAEPVYFGPNPESGFQSTNPFSHDDTIIKCWLSRMHYFDLRRKAYDVKPDDISYLCVKMSTLTYILKDIRDDTGGDRSSYPIVIAKFLLDVKYEENIKPILKSFSEIVSLQDYKNFWDEKIDEHKFLSKKVTKFKSRHMHTKIKTFIKNEILNTKINGIIINPELFVQLVKQYIETIDKYKVNGTYNFADAPESDITLLADSKCISIFIIINTYVADYYLLCRIFREFDLSLDANTERWTDEPKEPHNIIIYAGNIHSNKVRRFLKELDFDVIHSTDTSVENCIYMKDFPQPFFSNHPKVKWGDLDDIPMKLRNSIT